MTKLFPENTSCWVVREVLIESCDVQRERAAPLRLEADFPGIDLFAVELQIFDLPTVAAEDDRVEAAAIEVVAARFVAAIISAIEHEVRRHRIGELRRSGEFVLAAAAVVKPVELGFVVGLQVSRMASGASVASAPVRIAVDGSR